MTEKISLDMLTRDSVSIKKQSYIVQEKKEYAIGDIWRRAYVNSIKGRQTMENEVTEPYKSIIFLMWGDTPTMSDMTS